MLQRIVCFMQGRIAGVVASVTTPHSAMKGRSPFAETGGLTAVLVVAVTLRTIGLGFGLPAVYNPDEVAIMSRALAFATGDLNPHNFLYPTLYFYVLFVWIGAYFLVARVTGIVPSLDAFRDLFFTDPSSVYLAGRALGVACGAATVGLTYLLGRRLFGRTTGLLAALFVASAPLAVRDAHYVKHDVPVTLAIVAASLAIARLWPLGWYHSESGKEHGARNTEHGARSTPVWLAGSASGLACSTHYYAVFLAVPLAIGVAFGHRDAGARSSVRRLAVAGLASLATFVAFSPFILVEPHIAWRDIMANRQIVVDLAVDAGGAFASAGQFARMLWQDAIGWPVVSLAALGSVWLGATSVRLAALVLSFPLAFLLFISNTVAASRYLNPVLPFVAILAGYATMRLAGVVAPRQRHVAAFVAAGLACLPGLAQSLRSDVFFRQADTRTLAREFIERQIPAGATILIQPYSVPLHQSREGLREALAFNLGDAARASIKFAIRLALDPYPAPAYRTIFLGEGGLDADKIYIGYRELGGERGLAALDRRQVEYIVVKRYNDPAPDTRPFLEALAREGRLIAVFSPYRADTAAGTAARVDPFLHNTDTRIHPALERPGAVIEVWTR